MIRFGYAALNITLRKQHIFTNRTSRFQTIKKKGINYAIELLSLNLKDMLKILHWNEKHNIKLYRMSSSIAPHITNPNLLSSEDRSNFKKLGYDIRLLKKKFKEIGNFAKNYNHRLTFHPPPFINLGTNNLDILIKNKRELYFHALVLDLMELDMNSVIVIHGGGVYNNKMETIKRWVKNFNNLPNKIKRRLVLENDEFSYSIHDVLDISQRAQQYKVPEFTSSIKYKIPIVFDIFHYYCYYIKTYLETHEIKNEIEIPSFQYLLKPIILSWGSRRIKMHLSEQNPNKRFGAHSDYIKKIPKEILNFINKFHKNLDLMIEAKMKEKAVLKLKN